MGTAGRKDLGDSFEKGRAYINKVFYWVVKTIFCLLEKDKLLFHPDILLIQKHLIPTICRAQIFLGKCFLKRQELNDF